MGRYLNPGNGMFRKTVKASTYVDKTGIVTFCNTMVGQRECYVCVSRPRRFGKSVAADTLVAYYDRSCDSHDLFRGLSASQEAEYETHINKYDVIHINVADFLTLSRGMEDFIARVEGALTSEMIRSNPDLPLTDPSSLGSALYDSFAATGVPFVFVIDEWDAVFRVYREDHDAQARYLDWLRYLLKDQEYVALAYMTGILPIKKYGQHSALNMFEERSMADAAPIEELAGFTEGEVERLARRFGADLDQLRDWYDGYEVEGVSIFNPRSVVESVRSGKISNYWTKTESFEALRIYIELDLDGLREKVVRLVAGESVAVDTTTFQNDMTTFGSSDDVLTLLVHLGYLTYDSKTRMVRIPNLEVMEQYASTLRDRGWSEVARSIRTSEELLEATLSGNVDKVASLVGAAHTDVASALTYNDENSLACALSLAYYSARRSYSFVRELPAGVGFADVVLVPHAGAGAVPILLELKRDGSASTAIEQIHNRGYVESLRGFDGEAILVGISYDSSDPNKRHSCVIERVSLDT